MMNGKKEKENYAFRHIMFIARMMYRLYGVPLGTKSFVRILIPRMKGLSG
jgi:hypothetical protein